MSESLVGLPLETGRVADSFCAQKVKVDATSVRKSPKMSVSNVTVFFKQKVESYASKTTCITFSTHCVNKRDAIVLRFFAHSQIYVIFSMTVSFLWFALMTSICMRFIFGMSNAYGN